MVRSESIDARRPADGRDAEAIFQPDDRAASSENRSSASDPKARAAGRARTDGQPEIALSRSARGGRQIDQIELDLRRLRRRRAVGVGCLGRDRRGSEYGRDEPGGQARAAEGWSGETTGHV